MGSKDHHQALAHVLCLGYAAPLELPPQPSTSLEGQRRSRRASRVRPDTMAVRTHSGGELPLEDLLTLYGYDMSHAVLQQHRQLSETADTPPATATNKFAKDPFSGEEDEDTRPLADDIAVTSVTSHTADLLQCHLRVQNLPDEDKDTVVSSTDEDSDNTSIPSNDGRKDIMVGPQYQATIPPLSSSTCYERAYELEDQLLWTPGVLSAPDVEEFLLHVQRQVGQDRTVEMMTSGDTVKDNEQALYELVRCNFNTEEALRRLRFNVKVFSEELCAWSEEECRNFEHGYRAHGKNFHLIQANKVRTRSVGECVQYYYMWKKSDMHEYFTQQSTRLGRKKFSLQAGNMEDGDADVDQSEVDSSTFRPPSPPPVLQVEPSGATSDFREIKLCTHPHSSLQREALHSSFSPLPSSQELQRPAADCLRRDASVASPSPQFYTSSHTHQQEPDLLGSDLYQLQLGYLEEDGVSSATQHQAFRQLPTDCSSSTPTAITPSITVPDFGPLGGFMCPSSATCPPLSYSDGVMTDGRVVLK